MSDCDNIIGYILSWFPKTEMTWFRSVYINKDEKEKEKKRTDKISPLAQNWIYWMHFEKKKKK